jgi:4-hydroxybenzoate polyprenyltransferase
MKKLVQELKFAIKTSRPIFWILHFVAFFWGLFPLAEYNLLSTKILLGLIIFSLPLSIVIYGVNDLFDIETDKINDRKGGIWGLKDQDKHKTKITIYSILGLVIYEIALITYGWPSFIAGTILCIMLIGYSVPPIRLKQIPFFDHIFGGGLYASGISLVSFLAFSTRWPTPNQIIPFVIIFCGGFVSHALGAVLDYKADLESGETTSVTYFGPSIVTLYTVLILFTTMFFIGNSILSLVILLALILINLAFLVEKVRTLKFMRYHFAKIYIFAAAILTILIMGFDLSAYL